MQEWEVPREEEWIIVSENLKFFRHRYLSFKNELENFGVVSTSNVIAYKEIEKKMNFNYRRLEKYARKRREQITDIMKIREEVAEYGVVLPELKLTLDDSKDLRIMGEIVEQANYLKMTGHELAVYEGRGEFMHCLEDQDQNRITRQQFRRG